MSIWYFEKRNPYGVYSVPKYDEHFSHVRGIVTSIVRETAQNSGDASNCSGPVRMVFRFGKLNRENFEPYIDGLGDRLQVFPQLHKMLDEKTVKYLVIEDFETHGLRGSYDPASDAQDSSYITFWHRYGESGKSETHGGRHGLGKSTIASASKLRLFFGVTVPSDVEPRRLLLQGQISLKPHKYNGNDYDAYGVWYDGNMKPFIDKAANNFVHDFQLERGRQPGLSLVIPFPADELTPEDIVKAVIENAFHQIVSGHLVVRVDEISIDPSTIRKHAANYGLKSLEAAIELSAEVAQKKLKLFEASRDFINDRLKPDHFGEQDLRNMRKAWIDGDTIGVRLPVSIRRKGGAPQSGEVHLYTRRLQQQDQSRETYVRGKVSVPLKALAEHANCITLLVADIGVASTFLGDSEPPAHDKWLINRVESEYYKPQGPMNRIKYALRDLLQIMESGEDDQVFKDAFGDFLWIMKPEQEGDKPRSKGNPKKPTPPVAPPPTPAPHQLKRINAGFAYSYRPEGDAEAEAARIVVNYRRRSNGKAAKKATKFGDFNGLLPFEETGTAMCEQIVEPRQVIFELKDISPGYELQVTGFDPNRDIEIHLDARSS